MTDTPRAYRAICFDLDGTLLPMDIDEFMTAYFRRITGYAAEHGLDPELFTAALKSGTRAMAMCSEDETNEQTFWKEFPRIYGKDNLSDAGFTVEGAHEMADGFYEVEFGHIGDGFKGNPDVPRAIETLSQKGYPLLLTTMPMFPLRAVKHRLDWAGVDPDVFSRITSYENSKYVKPRQTYYAENLAAMGVRGEDVLMVGNNTMEDLSFLDLGADAFLITDWLLDPIDFDIETVKHGSFKEFADWCETLPDCADPAVDIARGPIERAAMEAAYAENAVREITSDEMESNAEALAQAIESDRPLGK